MRSAILFAVILSGCANSTGEHVNVLDQAPIDSALLTGDYAALSSCSYLKLDKNVRAGAEITKADLPQSNQSRLAFMRNGVKQYELTFTATGKNQTKVDLTAVQTMWGPDRLTTKNVMLEVRSCSVS